MTNSADLPLIPAKRYFTLEEACRLANIRVDQFVEWQRQTGMIMGKGGQAFTRLDVVKIRQLQHSIADYFAEGSLDRSGKPVIKAPEMRSELASLLAKIEKALAS